MSTMRWTVPVELFWTLNEPEPSVAKRTCALFARAWPALKLIALVAVKNRLPGRTRSSPLAVGLMTVRFTERVCAFHGIPHVEGVVRTVKLRVAPAARAGPPRGPVASRVSSTRQDVSG